MSTQYSVTRALVELKTLDKRIPQGIDRAVFVSYRGQFQKPAEGVQNAAANYQSINDLIDRRRRIKSAIVASNATTKVTICGQEMTIAEAIEMKSSIAHKKRLRDALKRQYGSAVSDVSAVNDRVLRDMEGKLHRTGNGTAEKEENKLSPEEFAKSYMNINGVELFDPINASQLIEELDNFITNFEDEVDFILSEKNATTLITV